MLYALTLAGFVFLFVTLWHFVFVRRSELEPSAQQGMDIYVSVFIAAILGVVMSKWLDTDFSLSVYFVWLGIMTFLILIFLLWVHIRSSPKRKLEKYKTPGEKPNLWSQIKLFFLRRVLGHLIVGVSMAVLSLYWLHEYPFLADPEDASMDFVMKWNQCHDGNCIFPEEKNIPPKIVLLNIDDETYKKWGKPLFTPRHCLKDLIEFSVKDGARLIVVDISLSQRSPTDQRFSSSGSCQDQVQDQDQALKDYLASYEKTHCGNGEKCPTIILVHDSLPTKTEKGGEFKVQSLPVPRTRQSFLEESIKSSPHIQWASPSHWVSVFDGVARRFWLWKPMCEEGKQKFIPSVELLVASLISKENLDYGTAVKEIEGMGKEVDPDFVDRDCSTSTDSYKPKPLPGSVVLSENVKIGSEGLPLTAGRIDQRIMFIMPWKNNVEEEEEGSNRPVSALTNGDYGRVKNGKEGKDENERILSILSAYRYLVLQRHPDSKHLEEAKRELQNNVVIIGNSHVDAEDSHKTPLGEMPGMLVIVNAIYSIFLNGGLIETFTLGKILGEALLIMIFGVALMGFFSSVARIWYWLVMIPVTVLVWFIFTWVSSTILWKDGIWIDFSLPLVAVFFHHVVDKFHELRQETKKAEKKLSNAKKELSNAKEEVDKVKKQLQSCQEKLDQCEQDKQRLSLGLTN
ncbi:MAG: hypothetical protein BWK78_02510 [Thiotrichaceae bacterium IS1]|nr:MAG: hypothetical protein BWK78_02510 [Thiotrichaceae bacterium IS1]